MTIPAPLAELLERNKEHQEYVKSMPSPPLDMPTMHKWAQENGGGVMVITCSDPRLNPYRILGVDAAREMSKNSLFLLPDQLMLMNFQRPS